LKNITIQSMTTTKTDDVANTTAQINRLVDLGCDVVRVAVPNIASADAIGKIKSNISIPLVADIHFDYKLALRAIDAGADKIRINPGNIGSFENVKAIAAACNAKNIPIRIGVNSGSLDRCILDKYGGVTAEAMFESVLGHVRLLNQCDFNNIWLSAKSSSVPLTVATYRLLHEQTDYPLHLGVTEAGTEYNGIIKSSIGIGALLLDGIGDTIRVSLTAEPEREIVAAKTLLRALNLRPGIDVISCPTCGRCNIDVVGIAHEVEAKLVLLERRLDGRRTGNSFLFPAQAVCPFSKPHFVTRSHETKKSHLSRDLSCTDRFYTAFPQYENFTVAVMGCAVNGPGEARQADFGIAGVGGNTRDVVLFAKGETIKTVSMDRPIDELFALISDYFLE
jgi:(E)-4-hydroxy-3-methylbut-2-enyl-diphosphate synthase